jgi:hypothetical protein
MERLNAERLTRLSGVTPAAPEPPVAASTDEEPAAPVSGHGPAWHKVGRSLGNVLGGVIEKVRWASGRVFNPKMLVVDLKASGRHIEPPKNWARDVVADFITRRAARIDVSVPYFENFVNMALVEEARKGLGYVYHSFKFLADLGKQGKENARKIIRWLEDHGWIGTLNTLYRDENDRSLKRGNNVYILFPKETAEEISAVEEPSARALKRESITLSRGAVLWNLMVRPWGLNATPLASNRHEILRATPAPT